MFQTHFRNKLPLLLLQTAVYQPNQQAIVLSNILKTTAMFTIIKFPWTCYEHCIMICCFIHPWKQCPMLKWCGKLYNLYVKINKTWNWSFLAHYIYVSIILQLILYFQKVTIEAYQSIITYLNMAFFNYINFLPH